MSGSPLGPPPAASSSEMCVRLRRCWSAWRIRGWGGCLVWPSLQEEELDLEEIVLWSGDEEGLGSENEEGGLGPP